MAITSERVREIFKGLEQGDGAAFFEHVADKVDWIVEGTHPLADKLLNSFFAHQRNPLDITPATHSIQVPSLGKSE
jgi:ketosteroid isomerase-like protein